jgi:hypothetical protein
MIQNPLSGRMVGANGVVGEMLLDMHKKKEIKLPQKDVAILKGGGVSNGTTNSTLNTSLKNTSKIPNLPLSMIFDGMFVPLSQNTSRSNIQARVKLMLLNKEVKDKFFKEIDRLTYDGRIDVLVGIIGDLKVREYVATQGKYKEIVDYIIISLSKEAERVYRGELLQLEDEFLEQIEEVNIDKKGIVVIDDKSRGIYPTIKLFKLVFVCSKIEEHFRDDQANSLISDFKTAHQFRLYANSLRRKILFYMSQTDGANNILKYTSGLCLPCEFDEDSYIKDVISMIRGLPIYLMACCGI